MEQNLTNQGAGVSDKRMAELEKEAAAIAKKHKVKKVHVYVHVNPETKEEVVAYVKEPSYVQKLFAMDKISMVGPFSAGEEMRQILTLQGEGESDPKSYDSDEANDVYRLGVAGFCLQIIKVANNQFKKK